MLTPPGGHGESKRPHSRPSRIKRQPKAEAPDETPDSLRDKALIKCFNTAVQSSIIKRDEMSKPVTLRLSIAVVEALCVHESARHLFARLKELATDDDSKLGNTTLATLANCLGCISICCRAVYALSTDVSECIHAQKILYCFLCPFMDSQQVKPIRLSNEEAVKTHCASAQHQRALATKGLPALQLAHSVPRGGCLVCDKKCLDIRAETIENTVVGYTCA